MRCRRPATRYLGRRCESNTSHSVAARYSRAGPRVAWRAGAHADAFALFQAVREALSRELGVDPGPELRQAYDEVLKPREQPPTATRSVATVNPAQLPRDLVSFIGRRSS